MDTCYHYYDKLVFYFLYLKLCKDLTIVVDCCT